MQTPHDPEDRRLEDQMQMDLVEDLLQPLEDMGLLTFNHAPLEGKPRPDEKAKQGRWYKLLRLGTKPGHPDIDIYIGNPARMLIIEIKTMTGHIRKSQSDRHGLLMTLGFDVRFLFADSSADLIQQVRTILRNEYGLNIP